MIIITILQLLLFVWAVIKILDLVIEMSSFLGGDGVQPYDIMWWICRPFSFREWSLFTLPMLCGLAVWIILIYGVAWSVLNLFFNF